MGTTVTPNLSLIRPDANEPIPNWPGQNGSNMDTLDALFRHDSSGTWIPAFTADTTNPTLGTGGFTEGKFLRLWPKMLIGHLRVFMGTAGFAGGSGNYHFSIPFNHAGDLNVMNLEYPIGKAIVTSAASVANSAVLQVLYDVNTATMIMRSSGGNNLNPTNPVTFTNNDRISAYFMYPTSHV